MGPHKLTQGKGIFRRRRESCSVILVVDYGMSNLRSVSKALEKLGAKVEISGLASDLAKAQKVVLPGVGAFGDAVKELEKRALISSLRAFAQKGSPVMGICLGLQLLFDSSDESPEARGLGVLPGKVTRFSSDLKLKIPHIGWNEIHIQRPHCPLTQGLDEKPYAYFVHSYYVVPDHQETVLSNTDYGITFPSMIWRNNIYGCQFHPEKSQETGLKILENFVKL